MWNTQVNGWCTLHYYGAEQLCEIESDKYMVCSFHIIVG
jgi:hypothetical protein